MGVLKSLTLLCEIIALSRTTPDERLFSTNEIEELSTEELEALLRQHPRRQIRTTSETRYDSLLWDHYEKAVSAIEKDFLNYAEDLREKLPEAARELQLAGKADDAMTLSDFAWELEKLKFGDPSETACRVGVFARDHVKRLRYLTDVELAVPSDGNTLGESSSDEERQFDNRAFTVREVVQASNEASISHDELNKLVREAQQKGGMFAGLAGEHGIKRIGSAKVIPWKEFEHRIKEYGNDAEATKKRLMELPQNRTAGD